MSWVWARLAANATASSVTTVSIGATCSSTTISSVVDFAVISQPSVVWPKCFAEGFAVASGVPSVKRVILAPAPGVASPTQNQPYPSVICAALKLSAVPAIVLSLLYPFQYFTNRVHEIVLVLGLLFSHTAPV